MTVSLMQWRAAVGIFNCRYVVISKGCTGKISENLVSLLKNIFCFYHWFESYTLLATFLYIFMLLRCHGDIELNPGPKNLKEKNLSVCHWNLNSIASHNFAKLIQLKAYISTYEHDFICLSETYLDSSIPDNLIEIEGYNLVRADHPANIKRGGVCIYYKNSLPVRSVSLPYFKEAILIIIKKW